MNVKADPSESIGSQWEEAIIKIALLTSHNIHYLGSSDRRWCRSLAFKDETSYHMFPSLGVRVSLFLTWQNQGFNSQSSTIVVIAMSLCTNYFAWTFCFGTARPHIDINV